MRAVSTAPPRLKHNNSWRLCCFRMRDSSKCVSKWSEEPTDSYPMFNFRFTRLHHARRVCLQYSPTVIISNLTFQSATEIKLNRQEDGFGGLVASMLASGTQVRGFKPGRRLWIFTVVKILSMPSSGGEVKESVPCPSFVACKRT
jgi:hypothetical protein